MPNCDTLIRNALIVDGSGQKSHNNTEDIALVDGYIAEVGDCLAWNAKQEIDATGLVLAPGFIDTHTHDDTSVIRTPQMLPKLSQGVTTVVVGNCGISAAPARLEGRPPDPMNLLGDKDSFCYPNFTSYIEAIRRAEPALNVAAFVGHTTLRNNHMDRLDRAATTVEVEAMREELTDALEHGALGLSTGLAYLSANAATTDEVLELARPLAAYHGLYVTHLRSEAAEIRQALEEALFIGQQAGVPVIVSHLKCAGIDNWGRSAEILAILDGARKTQPVSFDCYPYAAGSSTLDLRQVDERVKITITWSDTWPDMAGQTLASIADKWQVDQHEAAKRLQPAGAIYHSISETDMRRILKHPFSMIGSDGLPHDPHPHPRLWGTFPRVLGLYSREERLFPIEQAIYKMSGLPAQVFGLAGRGLIRRGYSADLVLFNEAAVRDTATFDNPVSTAKGIAAVWVNGLLSFYQGKTTEHRAGRFLGRVAPPQETIPKRMAFSQR